jgi:hypothetical protein
VRLQLVEQTVHHSQETKYHKIEADIGKIFTGPAAVFVKVNANNFR